MTTTRQRHSIRCLICCMALVFAASVVFADDFPDPVNTQAAGQHPPSPEEMVKLIDVPEGFNVTLFAGEPDVRQPIAFDFDDKGRVWVAENYTYGAHGKNDPNLKDRIIILEDTDGDGKHDVRKVFWDKGWMLTGLTYGYGGLWILNNGTLSFIADKDGDDIPDAEPVEMLNGWTMNAGHNFVNGLLWGHDGWLYGRHGITDSSWPGTPETPKDKRQEFNCGIWRFHPIRHKFEVVCNGTTNPWGLDYNEHGDYFMTNNVIGHLWHVIPGAHYDRMFGQDFNPNLYELMHQTADHYHWDHDGSGGKWSASRDGKADGLGGGHSHCGGMIYQGTNFPEKYRGKMFMCNTHGRCVNVDRLERHQSGYVAKHEPNFLKVNSPWFRGVELKYGPDGTVYMTDWSDMGECHDHDGVHRTSGRIYRIAYGKPENPVRALQALAKGHGDEFQAVASTEGWFSRHASRMAYETKTEDLRLFIRIPSEYDQARYIRRSFDEPDSMLAFKFAALAKKMPEAVAELKSRLDDAATKKDVHTVLDTLRESKSTYVALAAASAAQRIGTPTDPLKSSLSRSLLEILTRQPNFVEAMKTDRNLRLMTWYGILKHLDAGQEWNPDDIAVPQIRQFVYRYQATKWKNGEPLGLSKSWADIRDGGSIDSVEKQKQIIRAKEQLSSMLLGFAGRGRLKAGSEWQLAAANLRKTDDAELMGLVSNISILFGDGVAMRELRDLVKNRKANHIARENAIRVLADAKDADAVPILFSLLNDKAVYKTIAQSLASFDHPDTPKQLLRKWNSLRHGSKPLAVDTLISRQSYAVELAKGLEKNVVSPDDLTATQVRQLLAYKDDSITKAIESKWGIVQETPAARAKAIAMWKARLIPGFMKSADYDAGAALFKKTCANCHKLYGNGGAIGPDLTGSNRDNMDYLLSNILDPSQVVPKKFTMSTLALESGRVINGVVVAETKDTVTVQTEKELLKISVSEIEDRSKSNKSLMPDGLLDNLDDFDVRNLIGFLMQGR